MQRDAVSFPKQKFRVGDTVVRTNGYTQMDIVGVDYVIFYQTKVPNKWGTEDICDWTEEELQLVEPTKLLDTDADALLDRMYAAWGQSGLTDTPVQMEQTDCDHTSAEGLCYCETHNNNGFLYDNCPGCGMEFGARHLMEKRAEDRRVDEIQRAYELGFKQGHLIGGRRARSAATRYESDAMVGDSEEDAVVTCDHPLGIDVLEHWYYASQKAALTNVSWWKEFGYCPECGEQL